VFSYKKLFSIIFAVCCVPAISAVIPEIEVWSDGVHYRYLIKDWHVDYLDGRVSIAQQQDLLWAIEQKMADAFVLAEDSGGYDGSNEKIRNIYRDNKPQKIEDSIAMKQRTYQYNQADVKWSDELMEGSPLGCIIYRVRERNIRNYNVECAQIIELYQLADIFSANKKVTMQEVLDDLIAHIEPIGTNPKFVAIYTYFISEFEALKKVSASGNRREFIRKAFGLRRKLVDVKILFKIDEWNAVMHGFIYAGAEHIDILKRDLKVLGYTHMKSIGGSTIGYYVAGGDQKRYILEHALDLRKTFTQIFAEQQPAVKPVSFLTKYKASIVTVATAVVIAATVSRYWCK
jgi:hypothetical protein